VKVAPYIIVDGSDDEKEATKQNSHIDKCKCL
jgi:hypothetical protein